MKEWWQKARETNKQKAKRNALDSWQKPTTPPATATQQELKFDVMTNEEIRQITSKKQSMARGTQLK